ncbi:D-inositol-3-phosphate glycosyltransferase [subsurface metagenome]
MELSDITLTLFFTGGVGLKTWAQVGNLNREITIYRRLVEYLKTVNFVTYGGRADYRYAHSLGNISLYPISWRGSMLIKLVYLLIRHWPMLMRSDILKTNQIRGSEIPIWLKKHSGKKLIVRCGYLYSLFTERCSRNKEIIAAVYRLERNAFEAADICVVPTARDRDWVVEEHRIAKKKIRVVPNYVDVNTFHPSREPREILFDLVFVGQSGPQKNLLSLFKALAKLKGQDQKVRVLMIGNCSHDSKLIEIAENKQLSVEFVGNVLNNQLPNYLNQAAAFIIPSNYEGHPKALLEAMSCALPCIGTDVEGIRDEIKHRETGYLCSTDSESIADAIQEVLADKFLQHEMGENARHYIKENYSLERVLKMEIDVIREVMSL